MLLLQGLKLFCIPFLSREHYFIGKRIIGQDRETDIIYNKVREKEKQVADKRVLSIQTDSTMGFIFRRISTTQQIVIIKKYGSLKVFVSFKEP